jgi:DNA-binding IclR family transcriptional regulator
MNNTASRTLRILEFLSGCDRPVALAVLARELGIPKSSLHGLVGTLVGHRFLARDERGWYRLGVRAFEVGAAYLRGVTPFQAAQAELAELSRSLAVTAHLAVLDPPHALYLAREDPPGPGIRLASSVGARLPAHLTAVGKASLAHDSRKIADLVDLSVPAARGDPVSLAALARELEQVRRRGYAVDDGDTAVGIRCVAAPVFEAAGRCCCAIGVSYLQQGGPAAAEIGPAVVRAADRVSERLGWRVAAAS